MFSKNNHYPIKYMFSKQLNLSDFSLEKKLNSKTQSTTFTVNTNQPKMRVSTKPFKKNVLQKK